VRLRGTVRFLAAVLLVLTSTACAPFKDERPLDEVIAAAEGGDDKAIGELVARFGHPDSQEAQKAWEAVMAVGDPAEEELIRALEAKDPAVAEYAAGALGGKVSKGAVDPLIAALERGEGRLYVVVWALGEIGDPRAIPVLVETLGSDDAEVSKYATRSLVKFGPAATEALLEVLDDSSPRRRRYAVRALGEIRDRRSVEPLLALGESVDREVLLWALGRLGDPRGFSILAAAVGDRDGRIRLAAIQALRDLGDERAVPLLTAALEDEKWMVREWAARGLESITGNRYTYRDQHGDEVYPYALYR
jgi:HEAT repeat protein